MKITRHVNDLLWAITSQPLLAESSDVASTDPTLLVDEALTQRIDAKHLKQFLEKSSSHRVGRYFESLILYWLKHIRQLEIVAESLQIHDGNRTIGEIDLVFRDEQHRLTHWETAVKFYLHFPNPNVSPSEYIGPNASDNFESKIERLFQHQLPRSEIRFPDVELRQAFVKGRIFYHPELPVTHQTTARLAPDHLRGTWIRSSELHLLPLQKMVLYRVLHKPCWLSNETAKINDTDLRTPTEIVAQLSEHFEENDHPVLISQLKPVGERFDESRRIFVVSDDWPLPGGNKSQPNAQNYH